jgi:hypothetical protein
MTAATHPPDLEHAAARWQWALDAAARALDADRFFLPSEEISHEAKRLARERQETASLLRRVAALRGTTPAPWLASLRIRRARSPSTVRTETSRRWAISRFVCP